MSSYAWCPITRTISRFFPNLGLSLKGKFQMKTIPLMMLAFLPICVLGQTISLVADEWPPFNTSDPVNEGFMVEVARAIFANEGIKLDYRIIPWKRALVGTRKGEYDGIIGATKVEAPDFVFPEEELVQSFLSFFTLKNSSWVFDGEQSLHEITLAVVAGYDYRDWLNRYIEEHKNDEFKIHIMFGDAPVKRNLKLLFNGRVDVVVDNDASIHFFAKQMEIEDHLRLAGQGIEPAYLFIAFSPANPDSRKYAEILSKGIKNMKKSGKLLQFMNKYGLNDWGSITAAQ